MNYKTEDIVNEAANFQWPAVFDYKSENALFVLCKTSEEDQFHIKLYFDTIVSIQRDDRRDECTIITKDGKLSALAPFTDIITCLPKSKFANIRWNEVLNLSLVDKIDGNTLYVDRFPFYVDRKYAEEVFNTFHLVDKDNVDEQEPSSYHDAIFLRVGECYRRIKIDEILWIESYHNYCDIHMKNYARPYCSVFPLTAWQKILPKDHFLRLHRSLIVNANYVDAVESKAIYIKDNFFKIPKAHRHIVPQYFQLFQRKIADGISYGRNI